MADLSHEGATVETLIDRFNRRAHREAVVIGNIIGCDGRAVVAVRELLERFAAGVMASTLASVDVGVADLIKAKEEAEAARDELKAGFAAIGAAFKTGGMDDPAFLLGMVEGHLEGVSDLSARLARQQEGRIEPLERAVMLAILNIDCERNGLTPDGNVRERLVAVLNATPTIASQPEGK